MVTAMKPDMLSRSEEIFAPVAALYIFDSEDEVIAMTNNSNVGLGAYVCTKDAARQWRVAEDWRRTWSASTRKLSREGRSPSVA